MKNSQLFIEKLKAYKIIKKNRTAPVGTNTLTMDCLMAQACVPISRVADLVLFEASHQPEYIYLEGNIRLEQLDLDRLQQKCHGLIIQGNLIVDGGISNLSSDTGPTLIVTGDVVADYLIAGASEIYLGGLTSIHGFVVAHYNRGLLDITNLNTMVYIEQNHHCHVNGGMIYGFSDDVFKCSDHCFELSYLKNIFGRSVSFLYNENSGSEQHTHFCVDSFNEQVIKDDIALLDKLGAYFLNKSLLLYG